MGVVGVFSGKETTVRGGTVAVGSGDPGHGTSPGQTSRTLTMN